MDIPADVLETARNVFEDLPLGNERQSVRTIAQAILADRYRIVGALDILARVHLRDDDVAGFTIKMGAAPEQWHDYKEYVEAWETVHNLIKEARRPS